MYIKWHPFLPILPSSNTGSDDNPLVSNQYKISYLSSLSITKVVSYLFYLYCFCHFVKSGTWFKSNSCLISLLNIQIVVSLFLIRQNQCRRLTIHENIFFGGDIRNGLTFYCIFNKLKWKAALQFWKKNSSILFQGKEHIMIKQIITSLVKIFSWVIANFHFWEPIVLTNISF